MKTVYAELQKAAFSMAEGRKEGKQEGVGEGGRKIYRGRT